MTNCGVWPAVTCVAKVRATRCKLQVSSTRRTCGSWIRRSVRWQNRAHFFGIAAQLMRRILMDHARTRHRVKRGGGVLKVSLNEAETISHESSTDLLALDEALTQLAEVDGRKGRIVELRFFGGLSIEETAEVLQVSPGTVMHDWTLAKAWLYRALSHEL
jgi:RNA polymerase sigma-70 factor (ECF subfamily)